MEKQINLIDYFYYKMVQAIIFDDELMELVKKGHYAGDIFNDHFLSALIEFTEYMAKNNYLEDEFKNNLLILINYIRFGFNDNYLFDDIYDDKFSKVEMYKSVIQDLNELIRMINVSDGSKSMDFYLDESEKRLLMANEEINIDDYLILRKRVIIYIPNDFLVLNSSISEENNEYFYKNNFFDFSLKEEYCYSLSALIIENKNLINNKNFRERTNKILSYNIETEDYKDTTLKEKNKIKKQSKTLKKLFK